MRVFLRFLDIFIRTSIFFCFFWDYPSRRWLMEEIYLIIRFLNIVFGFNVTLFNTGMMNIVGDINIFGFFHVDLFFRWSTKSYGIFIRIQTFHLKTWCVMKVWIGQNLSSIFQRTSWKTNLSNVSPSFFDPTTLLLYWNQ